VGYLIQHLDFNKEGETAAIYAVLNEISEQLKTRPHVNTCVTIADGIDKILEAMVGRTQREEYMDQFLENYLYICSMLENPSRVVEEACHKIDNFFKKTK